MPTRRVAPLLLSIGTLVLSVGGRVGGQPVDQLEQARRYVREAQFICEQDGGALWGTSLCGPLLLVNTSSREIFANEQDAQHLLQKQGDVFVGKLSQEINVANTAMEWAGTKWSMVMLPLPADPQQRKTLLAHELWHRIQDQLGLPISGDSNEHLDTRDGRYWLQLEWRALTAALGTSGPQEKRAITDAGVFRARRHKIFPADAEQERSMEMHEGLAEYTGVRLSGSPDLRQFVIRHNVQDAASRQTFVRSFAYATGPAYGVLLDSTGNDWRKELKPGVDLANLLLKRRHIVLPDNIDVVANNRAEVYDGATLAEFEDRREAERIAQQKDFRARFADGAVLEIPLQKMNMQFDPGTPVPVDKMGTIYPAIRIVDAWGVLDVKERGALLSNDFHKVTISAPRETRGAKVNGEGWTLDLNAGWRVAVGDRYGSYIVEHQ